MDAESRVEELLLREQEAKKKEAIRIALARVDFELGRGRREAADAAELRTVKERLAAEKAAVSLIHRCVMRKVMGRRLRLMVMARRQAAVLAMAQELEAHMEVAAAKLGRPPRQGLVGAEGGRAGYGRQAGWGADSMAGSRPGSAASIFGKASREVSSLTGRPLRPATRTSRQRDRARSAGPGRPSANSQQASRGSSRQPAMLHSRRSPLSAPAGGHLHHASDRRQSGSRGGSGRQDDVEFFAAAPPMSSEDAKLIYGRRRTLAPLPPLGSGAVSGGGGGRRRRGS